MGFKDTRNGRDSVESKGIQRLCVDGVCYGWGDTMEAKRTEAEN